jgi:hypothetical protein
LSAGRRKDKRGKTLTTVYQHQNEQSYSSAHGGVRRQRCSICSRSFTVRLCQRCCFGPCQEASYYDPSPQSEGLSERGSQRDSSVGLSNWETSKTRSHLRVLFFIGRDDHEEVVSRLAPARGLPEIQSLVANVDNSVVFEKEVGTE